MRAMKKTVKKLSLSRETLISLDEKNLQEAAGGMPVTVEGHTC
jgi:hypothetical protein